MEKEQNNKFVDKEINAHCVANIEANWNIKSFSTQKPGGVPTLTLMKFQAINLLNSYEWTN